MSAWLVLLAVCSVSSQIPDPSDSPLPKPTIVKIDDYRKELDRLEGRSVQLDEEVEYLEALLARKKAEIEVAKAERTLYQLTHRAEPSKEADNVAQDADPDMPRMYGRPSEMNDEIVELPTRQDREKAEIESNRVTYRGRVVDAKGQPIAGVLVSVDSPDPEKEPLQTKTDPKGDYSFTIAQRLPRDSLFQIKYDARGHARRVEGLGEHGSNQKRLIKLEPGVSLKGSIVHQGQQVPKVKVDLVPTDGNYPGYLGEWTATTNDQGEFTFDGLPAGLEATMSFDIDSLKHLGAITTRTVQAPPLGEPRVLGPIEVGPAYKVAGQVIFRDDKPTPAGSILYLRIDGSPSGQQARLEADGRFEIHGMPPGLVFLSVVFPNKEYAPDGYRFASENLSLDHSHPFRLGGKLDRDITDLKVLFEPGLAWQSEGGLPGPAIPGDQADFEKQPLTGAPARLSKP